MIQIEFTCNHIWFSVPNLLLEVNQSTEITGHLSTHSDIVGKGQLLDVSPSLEELIRQEKHAEVTKK